MRFTKQIVNGYLFEGHIPEILSCKRINHYSSDVKEFIKYMTKIISEMEFDEQIASLYKLDTVCFKEAFEKLDNMYLALLEKGDITNSAALLRIEITIHNILDTSDTEDTAIFLKLLDLFSTTPELDLIVLLIYRKYYTWNWEFLEKYKSWLLFVLPFFEFFAGNNFNMNTMMELNTIKVQFFQTLDEYIMKMREYLKLWDGKINLDIKDKELDGILDILLQIKNELVQRKSLSRDVYCQLLGKTSFLVLMLRYILKEDLTFFRIITLTGIYIGDCKLNTYKDLEDDRFKPLNVLENLSMPRNAWYFQLQAIEKYLNRPELTKIRRLELCKLFESMLIYLQIGDMYEYSAFFEKDSEEIPPLLRIFRIIKENKDLLVDQEPHFHSYYYTTYDSILKNLGKILYNLFNRFPRNVRKQTSTYTNLVLPEVCEILSDNKVNPRVKVTFYSILILLLKDRSFHITIGLEHLGFSTKELLEALNENYIMSYNTEELELRMIYVSQYLTKKAEWDDEYLEVVNSSQMNELFAAFSTYVQIRLPLLEPQEKLIAIQNLNSLAYLLLNVVSLDSGTESFVKFEFIKNMLVLYEMRKFEPRRVYRSVSVFLKTFKNLSNQKELILNGTLIKVLTQFSDRVSFYYRPCNPIELAEATAKDKEAMETLTAGITQSIISLNYKLNKMWKLVSFEKHTDVESKPYEKLRKIYRKYIYSALENVLSLMKIIGSTPDIISNTSLRNLFREVFKVYFHPASILPLNHQTWRQLHEKFNKISEENDFFYQLIMQVKIEMLAQLHDRVKLDEILAKINCNSFINIVAAIEGDDDHVIKCPIENLTKGELSKQGVKLLAFYLQLGQFFSSSGSRSFRIQDKNDKEFLSNLEKGLKFIFNMANKSMKLLDEAQYNADEYEKVFYEWENFFIRVVSNVAILFGQIESWPPAQPVIAACVTEAFMEATKSENIMSMGISLLFIKEILSVLDNTFRKKLLTIFSLEINWETRILRWLNQVVASFCSKSQSIENKEEDSVQKLEIQKERTLEYLFEFLDFSLKKRRVELKTRDFEGILEAEKIDKVLAAHSKELQMEFLNLNIGYFIINQALPPKQSLKYFCGVIETEHYLVKTNLKKKIEQLLKERKELQESIFLTQEKIELYTNSGHEFSIFDLEEQNDNQINTYDNSAKAKELKVKLVGLKLSLTEIETQLKSHQKDLQEVTQLFETFMDKAVFIYDFWLHNSREPNYVKVCRKRNSKKLKNFIYSLCIREIEGKYNLKISKKIERKIANEEFYELKEFKTPILNEIFIHHVYFELWKSVTPGTNYLYTDSKFLLLVYQSSHSLVSKLINDPKLKDYCKEIADNSFWGLFKAFLLIRTEFFRGYLSKLVIQNRKVAKDLLNKMVKWVELVYETNHIVKQIFPIQLLDKENTLFNNVISLMQTIIDLEGPTESSHLSLNFLSNKLFYKSSDIGEVWFSRAMLFLMEKFIEKSLPSELFIELHLRKKLTHTKRTPDSQAWLKYIDSDGFVDEWNKIDQALMIKVLQKFEFKVFEPKNHSLDTVLDNVFIKLPTPEPGETELLLRRILSSLSSNARTCITFLMHQFIQNHWFTISHLFRKAERHEETSKEILSVISVMSVLFHNYPYLIPLVFEKHDFSKYLEQYHDLPFLRNLNLNEFKSINFLEAIFQSLFFTFYSHHTMIFLESLLSYTGITIQYQGFNQPLDISCLVINEVCRLVSVMLEQIGKNPSNEAYFSEFMFVNSAGILLTFLRKRLSVHYSSQVYQFFFGGINSIQNGLMNAISKLPNKLLLPFKEANILRYLNGALTTDLEQFYNANNTSFAEIKKLKEKYYGELLGVEDNSESLQIHNSLLRRLKDLEEIVQTTKNYNAPARYPYSKEENINRINKMIKLHQRKEEESLALRFTFDDTIEIMPDYTWRGSKNSFSSEIKSIANYFNCLVEQRTPETYALNDFFKNYPLALKKMRFDGCFNYNQTISDDLTVKIYRFQFENPLEPKLDRIKPPALKPPKTKIMQHMYKYFKTTSESQEEFKNCQEPIAQESNPIIPGLIKKNSEGKLLQTHIVQDTKIKYFLHATLSSCEQFKTLQSQMLIALKELNERILTSCFILQDNSEISKEKIIHDEVSQFLSKLSKFEEKLAICLFNNFESLKNLKYDCMSEIRKEYEWIKANTSDYIKELNNIRETIKFDEEPCYLDNITTKLKIDENFFIEKDIRICNNYQLDDQQSNKLENPEEAQNKALILKLRSIIPISENMVQAALKFLYVKYSRPITNDHYFDYFSHMCLFPEFESKVFDFFFFFLYCPEHIPLIKDDSPFPLNNCVDHSQLKSTTRVYSTVVQNIFDILNIYLADSPQIIYQPRIFLEERGLKSIQELKVKSSYLQKTSKMLSVFDLMIGLLNIPELKCLPELYNKIESIISNALIKPVELEIVDDDKLENFKMKTKSLSSWSCQTILKLKNGVDVFKNCPSIVFQCSEFLFKKIKKTIQKVTDVLIPINNLLKKDSSTGINLKLDHLKKLIETEQDLEDLQNLFSCFSSPFSNLFLKKDKNYIKFLEKSQLLLKELSSKILTNETVQDFILHLFELLNYVSESRTYNKSNDVKSIVTNVFLICLNYYCLLCIEEISKSYEDNNTAENFEAPPKLSLIASSTNSSAEETSSNLPEMSFTFSQLRKTREFNFDHLFSDLCHKYHLLFKTIMYVKPGESEIRNEVLIIDKKLPWILDFDTKKNVFRSKMMKNLKDTGTIYRRNIQIKRDELLESTVKAFTEKPLKDIRARLRVEFVDEAGIDAGGLRREYLTLITNQLFDPRRGLFKLSANGVSLQPSPLAKTVPSHLLYIELAGIMIAKAIQEDVVVDVNLAKPLLKHLLGREITISDLEDIDSELAKNMQWVLDNNVDTLEQPFVYEADILGQRYVKELVPDGYSVTVTDSNKQEFVKKICEEKMIKEIEEEVAVFLKGFNMVIPVHLLDNFTPSELSILIAGISEIDVHEMKKYAKYKGIDPNSTLMQWFWEIVTDFTQDELALLIYFISGSSKMPFGSFKERPIVFSAAHFGSDRLPVAHTCSWELELPKYNTKEDLRQKLLWAMFEGKDGFQLA